MSESKILRTKFHVCWGNRHNGKSFLRLQTIFKVNTFLIRYGFSSISSLSKVICLAEQILIVKEIHFWYYSDTSSKFGVRIFNLQQRTQKSSSSKEIELPSSAKNVSRNCREILHCIKRFWWRDASSCEHFAHNSMYSIHFLKIWYIPWYLNLLCSISIKTV